MYVCVYVLYVCVTALSVNHIYLKYCSINSASVLLWYRLLWLRLFQRTAIAYLYRYRLLQRGKGGRAITHTALINRNLTRLLFILQFKL
jgi:hypothetical protein